MLHFLADTASLAVDLKLEPEHVTLITAEPSCVVSGGSKHLNGYVERYAVKEKEHLF